MLTYCKIEFQQNKIARMPGLGWKDPSGLKFHFSVVGPHAGDGGQETVDPAPALPCTSSQTSCGQASFPALALHSQVGRTSPGLPADEAVVKDEWDKAVHLHKWLRGFVFIVSVPLEEGKNSTDRGKLETVPSWAGFGMWLECVLGHWEGQL